MNRAPVTLGDSMQWWRMGREGETDKLFSGTWMQPLRNSMALGEREGQGPPWRPPAHCGVGSGAEASPRVCPQGWCSQGAAVLRVLDAQFSPPQMGSTPAFPAVGGAQGEAPVGPFREDSSGTQWLSSGWRSESPGPQVAGLGPAPWCRVLCSPRKPLTDGGAWPGQETLASHSAVREVNGKQTPTLSLASTGTPPSRGCTWRPGSSPVQTWLSSPTSR